MTAETSPPRELPDRPNIAAQVIARSGEGADELLTFALFYPRIMLPEFNTHRSFSRSTASNRAVPADVLAKDVRDNPAVPVFFGANRPGMAATDELEGEALEKAKQWWNGCVNVALELHRHGIATGLHKQLVNRVLEPFQHAQTITTMSMGALTDFLLLRLDRAAQPEMQALAFAMKNAVELKEMQPVLPETYKSLHVPFSMSSVELSLTRGLLEENSDLKGHSVAYKRGALELSWLQLIALFRSAGRCARATYGAHLSRREVHVDVKTALSCWLQWHASPFEHQAIPATGGMSMAGWARSNLPSSWIQFRKVLETEEMDKLRDKFLNEVLPAISPKMTAEPKAEESDAPTGESGPSLS